MHFSKAIAALAFATTIAPTFAVAGSGEAISCDPLWGVIHYENEKLTHKPEDGSAHKELKFKLISRKKVASYENHCITREGNDFGIFSTTELVTLQHRSPWGTDTLVNTLVCRISSDSFPNRSGVDTSCVRNKIITETLQSYALKRNEETIEVDPSTLPVIKSLQSTEPGKFGPRIVHSSSKRARTIFHGSKITWLDYGNDAKSLFTRNEASTNEPKQVKLPCSAADFTAPIGGASSSRFAIVCRDGRVYFHNTPNWKPLDIAAPGSLISRTDAHSVYLTERVANQPGKYTVRHVDLSGKTLAESPPLFIGFQEPGKTATRDSLWLMEQNPNTFTYTKVRKFNKKTLRDEFEWQPEPGHRIGDMATSGKYVYMTIVDRNNAMKLIRLDAKTGQISKSIDIGVNNGLGAMLATYDHVLVEFNGKEIIRFDRNLREQKRIPFETHQLQKMWNEGGILFLDIGTKAYAIDGWRG